MRVVPLLVFLALPSMLLGAQNARDEGGAKAEIRRLEHEWVQAAQHADTAAFDRFIASDFQEVISNGTVHDRADRLHGYGSGRVRTTAADISDMHVRVNNDMAVVTGLTTERDSFPETGQVHDFQLRYVRLWQRRGARWQVVAIQWTAAQSKQTGGLPGANPRADSGSTEQTLERLDWQRFQAVQRADLRALDTLLADDWLASSGGPETVTKKQYLSELRSGKRWYGPITHDDVRVRIYGDVAIITGRATGAYRVDGLERNTSGRFTHIYARRNGHWVMVGMHNSPLPMTTSPGAQTTRARALSDDSAWAWSAALGAAYRVVPNITYFSASNSQSKLDLYLPNGAPRPVPTVIYFHGGGWMHWSRERGNLHLLPYLALGFAAVNVDYRLGPVASAPAAVEDSRCALRWVIRHASEYNLDTARIVVTGHSAGGHLALMTAMLPVSAGFDRPCMDDEVPSLAAISAWHEIRDVHVAAVINWYGMPDVADLVDGPNMKSYAVAWLGSRTDRIEFAKRLSPVMYARAGVPPVLTVHGDADAVSPYSDAVRLHAALTRAGARNELVTIQGGGHGGFTREQTLDAYRRIRAFLERNGVR